MKQFIKLMLGIMIIFISGCGRSSSVDKQETLDKESKDNGALHVLTKEELVSSCHTQDGYYYLSHDIKALKDGNYGVHLMYMDFATHREIFLCSNAGCKHDTLECPAVFSMDEFPVATTKIFIYHDSLYILAIEPNQDGSMVMGQTDNVSETINAKPAVLYRANLDGTNREPFYTFDASLTIEETVFGDEQGMYFITKKVTAQKDEQSIYSTSSERKLLYLDEQSQKTSEICSLEFHDHMKWDILGVSERALIMVAVDFGRDLDQKEIYDDDVYRNLYQKSDMVYAQLDLDTKTYREIERRSNQYLYSEAVIKGKLFLSSTKDNNIESIDLESGERTTIATLNKNLITDVIDDTLCCRGWDLASDPTYEFVDTKSGEIHHSGLVNQMNGWSLEFRAVTDNNVMVVHDYDAERFDDGSYEIHQYKYALISKSDLFQGKENYHPIEMISKGQ